MVSTAIDPFISLELRLSLLKRHSHDRSRCHKAKWHLIMNHNEEIRPSCLTGFKWQDLLVISIASVLNYTSFYFNDKADILPKM